MNKYEPYDPTDIRLMLYEPWEISDRPYMLHAAYALSCLYETIAPMDEGDELEEGDPRDSLWGATIPQKILDRLVLDIQDSFNDAAANSKQIDIWGKRYSIRKVNAYDNKRLHLIFSFPLSNGEYTVVKEGVINLCGVVPDALQKYELSRNEVQTNKTFLRQVVLLAEDDEHGGWDKLTDMEVAVYCWAQFYTKRQIENMYEFQRQYKDYLYVSESEMMQCFTEKAILQQKPKGLYTFMACKVQEWNNAHHQKSYIDNVPKEQADDYWYNTAIKTTFKPIDERS